MTMSSRFQLVVTDLDNTLYDWVTYFTNSFFQMVAVAAPLLDVEEDALCEELKAVHQRHHNTEHPFALLETEAVERRFPGRDRRARAEALDDAFHAFNRTRDQQLKLYPGVASTLDKLRAAGIQVVGHTEATVPNALFRLKKLGLERHIARLYAVEPSGPGHPRPERETELRQSGSAVRYLRQDERKPDPQVLLDICDDVGVPVQRTIYVGDSISRDIGMAKEAGAAGAWAKYGTEYDKSLWKMLVTVTHWTAEDVHRAEAARERYGDAKPDFTLEAYSDLLAHVGIER